MQSHEYDQLCAAVRETALAGGSTALRKALAAGATIAELAEYGARLSCDYYRACWQACERGGGSVWLLPDATFVTTASGVRCEVLNARRVARRCRWPDFAPDAPAGYADAEDFARSCFLRLGVPSLYPVEDDDRA